jgi:oxalate decarboxylase
MSGGLMVIEKGKQRNLHWHVNANEWQCYLRGKGQVALFESGGRGKVTDVNPGRSGLNPDGFRACDQDCRRQDLEIVQTWDNGKFEEIDLDRCVRSTPNYLPAHNFPGVP